MSGQMSLFDFIEDPDREKKEKEKAWSAGRQFAEGYREGIIDRPFSTGTDPDPKACDRWSPEKTENETG